jgi:hypothetical protein
VYAFLPMTNGLDADLDMISRFHQLLAVLALVLLGSSLSGCASMNERASAAMGDYIPQWAGGLPADAPPRPGTAKYDEWMKERERLRQLPADQRPPDPEAEKYAGNAKPSMSSSSPTTSKPASNPSTKSTSSSGSTPSVQDPVH